MISAVRPLRTRARMPNAKLVRSRSTFHALELVASRPAARRAFAARRPLVDMKLGSSSCCNVRSTRSPRPMTKKAPEQQSVVFVVDDDPSMRNALARLFRSVDLQTEVFGSTHELLRSARPDAPSCLV